MTVKHLWTEIMLLHANTESPSGTKGRFIRQLFSKRVSSAPSLTRPLSPVPAGLLISYLAWSLLCDPEVIWKACCVVNWLLPQSQKCWVCTKNLLVQKGDTDEWLSSASEWHLRRIPKHEVCRKSLAQVEERGSVHTSWHQTGFQT